MANDPFDPPLVKIYRTLQRGGLAGANRGAGSVRGTNPTSRPAPGPQELTELADVDASVTPVDGDTLVFDNGSGLWVPRALNLTELGDVDESVVPNDGDVLTYDTGSGLWAPAANPSALNIKDRRWVPGPGQVSIDEFNEETLDGSWIRVDAAGEAGHLTYRESGGVLSLLHTGQDSANEIHGLVKPLGSFGIGDTLETAILGPWGRPMNFPMAGLVLSDGTTHGAGVQLVVSTWYASNNRTVGIRRMTGWNAFTANADLTVGSSIGTLIYLRLIWLAENSFQWGWSADGVSWIMENAFAATITPTHLGLMASTWGGSFDMGVSFEYIRSV